MDIVSTIYQELFSVKFLHSGYGMQPSDTIARDIELTPDEGTKKLFAGYNISYRVLNDTLVCFIRSKLFNPPARNPKVPFISFFGDIHIRFLMFATQSFINKTGVVAAGKDQVYQFSNTIDNVIATDKFINKPVGIYDANKDYDADAIVVQSGQLFITVRPVLTIDNIAINDIAYWKQISPVEQLVNNADLADADTLELKETCFAVIDIHNNGTTNTSYDLFGSLPDNQLQSPVYSLKFNSKI